MRYRIVLVKNKKKKLVLFSSSSHELSIDKFRELRKYNTVDLPQRFINYKKIIPVNYEILLLKERTEGDENRLVRNNLGQLVKEENNSKKWVILDSSDYQIEETFWVYGYDNRYDRFTVRDIIKRILMKNINTKKSTKQIVIVKNKLIIQGDDLDFIICKCPEDCLRLHNKLKEIARNSKISKLLFLGNASEITAGSMYDLIEAKTGWSKTKIWRTTTRP